MIRRLHAARLAFQLWCVRVELSVIDCLHAACAVGIGRRLRQITALRASIFWLRNTAANHKRVSQ